MTKLALNLGGYNIDENFSNFPGLKGLRGTWAFGGGTKPLEIINTILPFFFVIAGLVLFVMIVFGGFTIFTSAGNPEKIKHGQGIIVNALVGFLIMFAAYWIIQLLETTLGFRITPAAPPSGPIIVPPVVH